MTEQGQTRGLGLTGRLLFAWQAPVTAIRAEIADQPEEARLLAYAFGASIFLMLGPLLAEAIRPALAFGAERTGWFGATILIGMTLLPLGLYASAALMRLICRPLGGSGDWRAARLALFWSALVSGPLAVLAHVIGAFADLSWMGDIISGCLWATFLAPAVSETMGFDLRRAGAVLAGVMVLSIAARQLA